MLKRLKNWYRKSLKWARTEKTLVVWSFAESSFFPIPPDPILLNMVLEKPRKWRRLSVLTSISSILGGVFGYIIGIALFESVGNWIIQTYSLQEQFTKLGELFAHNGLLAIFAAALTPIPYKIFTITAGAFKLNFFIFMIASIFGRTLRFMAVGYAGSRFGKKYSDQIGKYIDRISIAIIVMIAILVVLVSLLF